MKALCHVMITTLAACALWWHGDASAANITIDPETRYQTIEGFGAFGAKQPWWAAGPYYDDDFIRTIIDTVGVTIIRTELYPPTDEQHYLKQIDYFKAVKAYTDACGEPLKVIASIWTPPKSFKTNGELEGGHLIMSKKDAFADYLVDYLKRWKEDIGFDIYALSPQNEPQLSTGYNSCTYTSEDLAQVVIATANKIRAAGLPTKLFISDDLSFQYGYCERVVNAVADDPVTIETVGFFANHYAGRDYYPAASDLPSWYDSDQLYGNYGNLARQHGKTAWNSEFGNGEHNWNIAFRNALAKVAMMERNYSAVMYWYMSGGNYYQEAVLNDGHMTDKGYSLMAFSRHIRPGAVRIGCSSDDADVRSIAFVHGQQLTTTVIVMNKATSTRTATIGGEPLPPETKVYQFSSTKRAEPIGTYAAGNSITLPLMSITVLYNQPSVATRRPMRPSAGQTRAGDVPATRLYSLDGRCVGPRAMRTGRTAAPAASVYVAQTSRHGFRMEAVVGLQNP